MSEEELRIFFADVELIFNIKLGLFCDRNQIFRSDFTNFRKGKKYWTSLRNLNLMTDDIIHHLHSFLQIYE